MEINYIQVIIQIIVALNEKRQRYSKQMSIYC